MKTIIKTIDGVWKHLWRGCARVAERRERSRASPSHDGFKIRSGKRMLAVAVSVVMWFGLAVGKVQGQVAAAKNPVIEGVAGIRFGASKSEAKRIMLSMPGVELTRDTADFLNFSGGSFEGLNVLFWNLVFLGDKCCKVHIRLFEGGDRDVVHPQYLEAKRILTLRYGSPTDMEGKRDSSKWAYLSPTQGAAVTILCRITNFGRGNVRGLAVFIEYVHNELYAQWEQTQRTAKPQSTAASTQASSPVSGRPRADPELQKNAKPFAKNQSSIKGLHVTESEGGPKLGGVQDIIATVETTSPDLETDCYFAAEVAKDTKTCLGEAVSLVKARHQVWKAGHRIRFSFSEKYIMQAGGSAGAAFSLLLLSLLEGIQIDPGCAVTGDVTVDGKIRVVGGIAKKIRGATMAKCALVAVPSGNKTDLNDLTIRYGASALSNIQIFAVENLDQALALTRQDKPEAVAKAIALFASIQKFFGAQPSETWFRSPSVTRTLVEVARLAPNHLSADLLLRYARGQLVQTLTLEASLDELLTIGRPFLTIRFVPTMIWQNNNLRFVPEARVEKISQEAATKARDRLVSLRPRLDPRTLDLSDTLVECINYRGGQQKLGLVKPSAAYLQARDRVIGWLTSMLSDPKVLEELTVKISDGDGKGSRP